MEGRWHGTCVRIRILLWKGNENNELRTGFLCLRESYQQLEG
jgi:hypothetical protein